MSNSIPRIAMHSLKHKQTHNMECLNVNLVFPFYNHSANIPSVNIGTAPKG